MLFDLRSRRRRNTVRIIYVFLAIVMVAGLLLVGVGTGSGGGILNAIGGSNNGGGGVNGNSQRLAQLNTDLKAAKRNPKPTELTAVMVDRLNIAEGLKDGNKLTPAGTAQLQKAAAEWQQLLSASGDKPPYLAAKVAADVYQTMNNWTDAASAWEYAVTATAQKQAVPFECLALNSYATGDSSQGALAAAKALKLAKPQLNLTDYSSLQSALQASKKSKTTAQTYAAENC